MHKTADAIEWLETPRMRWRAIGVGEYVLQFALSIILFAAVFAGFAAVYVLVKRPPWWYREGWTSILFLAEIGAILRFVLEVLPKTRRLDCKKPSVQGQVRQRERQLSTFHGIHCAAVNGVLRLSLDAGTGSIVVAAHLKDTGTICSILTSSGRPYDFDGNGFGERDEQALLQEPTDDSHRYKISVKPPSVQFPTGLIIIGLGVYLLWLPVKCLMSNHFHAPLWFLAFGFAIPIVMLPVGVLLVRQGCGGKWRK